MRRANRDAVRRTHRPFGPDRQCAVHDEQWPCDAIELLDELEEVEAAARKLHGELQELRAERDVLEGQG